MAKGILIAAMDFSACREDEFHDCIYNLEHVPERLRVPGLLNAERWIDAKNPKVAVATYDLELLSILRSAPNSSPWTKRTAKFRKGLIKYEGEPIFLCIWMISKDAVALLIAMNVAPEHEAEFDEWYKVRAHPGARWRQGHIVQPGAIAAPARRSDIPRALPSRLDRKCRIQASGRRQRSTAVDRAHAAALSGPSSLRMPALRAGRLNRSGVKRGSRLIGVAQRRTEDAIRSYVCLQDEDKIAAFSIDADTGQLTPQAELPVAGGPSVMAISPDRRTLYVGHRTPPAIPSLRIDPATGGLSLLGSIPQAHAPTFLAPARAGRYLLSAYYQGGMPRSIPWERTARLGLPRRTGRKRPSAPTRFRPTPRTGSPSCRTSLASRTTSWSRQRTILAPI